LLPFRKKRHVENYVTVFWNDSFALRIEIFQEKGGGQKDGQEIGVTSKKLARHNTVVCSSPSNPNTADAAKSTMVATCIEMILLMYAVVGRLWLELTNNECNGDKIITGRRQGRK
jgi:hypothetical protein